MSGHDQETATISLLMDGQFLKASMDTTWKGKPADQEDEYANLLSQNPAVISWVF